jgi:hypothetical protein
VAVVIGDDKEDDQVDSPIVMFMLIFIREAPLPSLLLSFCELEAKAENSVEAEAEAEAEAEGVPLPLAVALAPALAPITSVLIESLLRPPRPRSFMLLILFM